MITTSILNSAESWSPVNPSRTPFCLLNMLERHSQWVRRRNREWKNRQYVTNRTPQAVCRHTQTHAWRECRPAVDWCRGRSMDWPLGKDFLTWSCRKVHATWTQQHSVSGLCAKQYRPFLFNSNMRHKSLEKVEAHITGALGSWSKRVRERRSDVRARMRWIVFKLLLLVRTRLWTR